MLWAPESSCLFAVASIAMREGGRLRITQLAVNKTRSKAVTTAVGTRTAELSGLPFVITKLVSIEC